ncbi:MAG: ComF family protein [Candidatus Hydrogenedentes bacterium]|nr:ComF family protein [Candidatus Hydrogenedentota bacterium]
MAFLSLSEIRRHLREEWRPLVMNLLLPMYCKQCGARLLTEENHFFCPDCWEGTPRIERPFCICCGKPHQKMVGLGSASNFPCAACREKPNRQVRRIWGAVQYDGAISLAIRLFKFQGKTKLCEPLAALMVEFAQREMDPDQYDCIVPVPLYKVRKRERGFNQSQLLAEVLVRDLFTGAVLEDTSLRRIRPTRAQSRLKTEERAMNVRGAFAVQGDALKGKRVLLIDDVITTGDTITECAKTMRRAGAAEVDAFAVALAFKSTRFDV